MRKLLLLPALVLIIIGLTGCGKYEDYYKGEQICHWSNNKYHITVHITRKAHTDDLIKSQRLVAACEAMTKAENNFRP